MLVECPTFHSTEMPKLKTLFAVRGFRRCNAARRSRPITFVRNFGPSYSEEPGDFVAWQSSFFGMNQSLDGYVDRLKRGPGPVLVRHLIEHVRGLTGMVYGRRVLTYVPA